MITSPVLVLGLCLWQMMSLQQKPVARLYAPRTVIPEAFRGELLELINSAKVLTLPGSPPLPDGTGNPWLLDVKNLGPIRVTVSGAHHFLVPVEVGETVHIKSNGAVYSLVR